VPLIELGDLMIAKGLDLLPAFERIVAARPV
jgi:hypothetical protein